ncbi:hypothetical protein CRH09_32215 [Nocardia terpenica]|uniref:Integrase catalytic domain-containing protein n=1 Tax=Nocardia terpenica TaxID=455432 RepID=A0A291RS97_9NOCA|nr:hypothetical protein CRH09_32215 [Nocardia terpenica]
MGEAGVGRGRLTSQPVPALGTRRAGGWRANTRADEGLFRASRSIHLGAVGESLFLAGMVPSVGSVADAYDNALAENTIGYYKTESVRDSPFRRGPLATLADVELLTLDWVDWFNSRRLTHRLGRKPPVEYEADYYAQRTGRQAGIK